MLVLGCFGLTGYFTDDKRQLLSLEGRLSFVLSSLYSPCIFCYYFSGLLCLRRLSLSCVLSFDAIYSGGEALPPVN